jgi:hypothetical protein
MPQLRSFPITVPTIRKNGWGFFLNKPSYIAMNDLAQKFAEELDLPDERAERTAELATKLKDGTITKAQYCELATTVFTRREMKANDNVNRYGIKPFFGLKHLADDDKGPSVNDLMRATFSTVEDKDDVISAWDDAQQAGSVYVTDNIVAFHTGDITFTDDGFEITPETRSTTEAEPESEDEDEKKHIMSASEAVGL